MTKHQYGKEKMKCNDICLNSVFIYIELGVNLNNISTDVPENDGKVINHALHFIILTGVNVRPS